MQTLTWSQLEPLTVDYADVNIGRLTRSVLNVSRDRSGEDRPESQRWLCGNTPYSMLGLAYAMPQSGTVKATVLTEATNVVLGIDNVRALPAGTDVRAIYSDGRAQFVTFDVPDPQLGVRCVPPFLARMHNGCVLAPRVASIDGFFSPDGQMQLMLQMRQLAVEAGSNSHVADLDRRLGLAMRQQGFNAALAS